jgi:hypothetical protein
VVAWGASRNLPAGAGGRGACSCARRLPAHSHVTVASSRGIRVAQPWCSAASVLFRTLTGSPDATVAVLPFTRGGKAWRLRSRSSCLRSSPFCSSSSSGSPRAPGNAPGGLVRRRWLANGGRCRARSVPGPARCLTSRQEPTDQTFLDGIAGGHLGVGLATPRSRSRARTTTGG